MSHGFCSTQFVLSSGKTNACYSNDLIRTDVTLHIEVALSELFYYNSQNKLRVKKFNTIKKSIILREKTSEIGWCIGSCSGCTKSFVSVTNQYVVSRGVLQALPGEYHDSLPWNRPLVTPFRSWNIQHTSSTNFCRHYTTSGVDTPSLNILKFDDLLKLFRITTMFHFCARYFEKSESTEILIHFGINSQICVRFFYFSTDNPN
jgi:hypothetical protein